MLATGSTSIDLVSLTTAGQGLAPTYGIGSPVPWWTHLRGYLGW